MTSGRLGFALGVAFGLLSLVAGFRDSLTVLLCGIVGAVVFVVADALRQLLPDLRLAVGAVMDSRRSRSGRGGD